MASHSQEVDFNRSMDPHARDVVVNERRIGSVQWHEGRNPRFVQLPADGRPLVLDLEVMQQIVDEGLRLAQHGEQA